MTKEKFIAIMMLYGMPKDEAEKLSKCFMFEIRPKGKWRISRVHGGIVKCDFCGFDWGSNEGRKFNYCPNCGADMRGEE